MTTALGAILAAPRIPIRSGLTAPIYPAVRRRTPAAAPSGRTAAAGGASELRAPLHTDLADACGPSDLGSTGGTNVIGNPSQGTQGGERTLAASTADVLCMQVSLPPTTGSSFQGLSTTATFDFYGEQTANNA